VRSRAEAAEEELEKRLAELERELELFVKRGVRPAARQGESFIIAYALRLLGAKAGLGVKRGRYRIRLPYVERKKALERIERVNVREAVAKAYRLYALWGRFLRARGVTLLEYFYSLCGAL